MHVFTDISRHVARITFHYPPVNALPSLVLKELETHLIGAGERTEIKVIVLQSEGKTFCAGADFEELLSLNNLRDAKEFFMSFGRIMNTMRRIPKPVLVRLQGKAVGGGLSLIAAADWSVAVPEAAFKLSELSIGIGPYVIAPAIIRKTGRAFFQAMSMRPFKWFSAFDLAKHGLITTVAENIIAMDEQIEQMTDAYAGYDSEAIAALKAECWNDTSDWERILPLQAEKSARLLLRRPVKDILNRIKKS